MIVEPNVLVEVEYTLSVDEKIIENSRFEFIPGDGTIIPDLERQLMGLKLDEEFNINVSSADIVGEYDAEKIMQYPIEEITNNDEIPEEKKESMCQVGAIIPFNTPFGDMAALVTEVNKDMNYLLLDFNHPFIGKTLNFVGKIVNLQVAPEAQSE